MTHFQGKEGKARTAGIALAMADYLEAELRQNGVAFECAAQPARSSQKRAP